MLPAEFSKDRCAYVRQKQDTGVSQKGDNIDKQAVLKEFRLDMVDYFKTKLTKEGNSLDPSKMDPRNKGLKGPRMPKRVRANVTDSVDDIASNLRLLIEFSREQNQRMRHLKKVTTLSNKQELQTTVNRMKLEW